MDQVEPGRHYRSCATEWGWREDEYQPPYKRPKAIVRANAKTQLEYQPTFHTKRKTVARITWRGTGGPSPVRWYHLEGHGGTKSSLAVITAHALPSGDGEKMNIGHPTNDPRPSFGQKRKRNSNTNPPFTRKERPLLVSPGGAPGAQVLFAGIIWRGTGGPSQAREPHDKNPFTTPRTWIGEGEFSTYASRDEHGRHYCSCATKWGSREDENRPPYKRPKAVVRANAKTQLDYQPTFLHRKKNCHWYRLEGHEGTKSHSLVSSGGARRDQVGPGSHTTTTHTKLQGLGE